MSDTKLQIKKAAVVGLGKLGTILTRSFLREGVLEKDSVVGTVAHEKNAQRLSRELGIRVSTNNRESVAGSDVVILSVKPQLVRQVCEEISPALETECLVISTAASVPTAQIESLLLNCPVVRAMPNTPCLIGLGMTGIAKGSHATETHLETARRLFESVGETAILDEKHMDAVTGLSGSGPAFVYVILEALAEAGVKVGLPRDIATLLAAQTALGASKMVLETGSHPALLKDVVTTPAGCTIDGIMELEEGKLRVTLIKAVVKAVERSRELVNHSQDSD